MCLRSASTGPRADIAARCSSFPERESPEPGRLLPVDGDHGCGGTEALEFDRAEFARPCSRRGDYFGPVVNLTARLEAAGHGGQVLVTDAVRLAAGVDTPRRGHQGGMYCLPVQPDDMGSDPLPQDPTLAEMAMAMRDATHWAALVDPEWRVVYTTDDLRLAGGFMVERAPSVVGMHLFGSEHLSAMMEWRTGEIAVENMRSQLAQFGGWVLEDTPGGHEALRALVDPRLLDIVDQLATMDQETASSGVYSGFGVGGNRPTIDITGIRLRDAGGRLAGTAIIQKPHLSMSVLAGLGAEADVRHLERMQSVASAGRRPAAILFADLEGSSPLSRKLSTANYFSLGRRMARAADRCIIEAGGMTGRHVGDGVVAFFVAEHYGSESEAASACIGAARALTSAMQDVATRSDLGPEDLRMRYGLHWGATLYIGQITTAGRTEVTALGDEVNEGARIEACATGGRALASKPLIERLEPAAAEVFGIDLDQITYTPLGELTTATEKARRDAPAIAVCDLSA